MIQKVKSKKRQPYLSALLNSTEVTSSECGTKRQVRPMSSSSSLLLYHRLSAPLSSPPASSSRPASGKTETLVSFSSARKNVDLESVHESHFGSRFAFQNFT